MLHTSELIKNQFDYKKLNWIKKKTIEIKLSWKEKWMKLKTEWKLNWTEKENEWN